MIVRVQDEDKNLWEASDSTGDAAKEALNEIFEDPANDDGPRDSRLSRWAKFLVIILALGLLVGGFGVALAYSQASMTNHRNVSRDLTDKQWADTVTDMHQYFVFGFGVGALIGASYVVKCIVRKVDP